MEKFVCRSQLGRLIQILLALRAGRAMNANELAKICEVSRRTVYRDLDTLAQSGVPVAYRHERQGYLLASSFEFDSPPLEPAEVVSLVLLAAGNTGVEEFGLEREAHNVVLKLVQCLSVEVRQRVLALVEQVDLPRPSFSHSPEHKAVHETILQALQERRQVRIWFQDPQDSETHVTKVSPYRLHRDEAGWSLIGRSTLHRTVRTFRLSRIEKVVLTEDACVVPPRFSRNDGDVGNHPTEVRIRFAAEAQSEARATIRRHHAVIESQEGDQVVLAMKVGQTEELLGWLLGLGDRVEVLAPLELRDRVCDVARRIVRNHLPATVAETDPSTGRNGTPQVKSAGKVVDSSGRSVTMSSASNETGA